MAPPDVWPHEIRLAVIVAAASSVSATLSTSRIQVRAVYSGSTCRYQTEQTPAVIDASTATSPTTPLTVSMVVAPMTSVAVSTPAAVNVIRRLYPSVASAVWSVTVGVPAAPGATDQAAMMPRATLPPGTRW